MATRMIIPYESGQLEARLREPESGKIRGGAVLCHPHPVYGGSMDNRVVYHAAKAAAREGFAALRFNFRGVGASTGAFDYGVGEKDDVTAAIDWLAAKYPRLPLALVGYSFGAWVGLQVAVSDRRVRALVGLGLPLDVYSLDFLIDNTKPALYIVGTQDEFCSLDSLSRLSRRLKPSSSVQILEGSDHFFTGHIERVEEMTGRFFHKLELDQDSA
jgi:alpha/beta superfamily hydrolase